MISDTRGTALFEIAKITVQDPYPVGQALKSRDLVNAMIPHVTQKMSSYKTEDLKNFLTDRKTSYFKIFKKILLESYEETIKDYKVGIVDLGRKPKRFSDAAILSEPLVRYLQSQSYGKHVARDNYKRLIRHVADKLDLTNDIIQYMITLSKNPILKDLEELSLEARQIK